MQTNLAEVFCKHPKIWGFFRKNRKLLKIDRNGLSNWTFCSKLQQFRFKVCQAECNRCDSTGNPWAFVFSFRTESICASRQHSYVLRPPPHNCRLFLDFGAMFSQVTLNFLVNTIHQVTPVAGLIFETKNRAIFLERFFGREITAREQLSRAVILARF